MSSRRKARMLYHGLGYVTVFTYFRFFHAPYKLVSRLIPKKGKIIDLGCGYGFFANMLGIDFSQREVIGVELNKRKLKHANKGIKNVTFINEDITDLKIDDSDVVVLFHVLHHLNSFQQQHRLLKACCEKLKKGGKIIVVEIDYKPLWKFLFTYLIDFSLYIGDKFHYRSKEQFIELFKKVGLEVERVIPAHRFVPLSHMVYVGKKI